MAKIEQNKTTPDVFPWLKSLPLAPEYHPTVQEFQDPISYIFKIEKEASVYGICKIVPPLPPPSKKSVISNFNDSILLLNSGNNGVLAPAFATRQQQVGFCPRRQRPPVQKSVWQSGERYTLDEFEEKAKSFEKGYLKRGGGRGKKVISPLEVETLYWKANGDRPFSVEYANDMAGSGFDRMGGGGGGVKTVGDTEWNMRGVARAKTSLLRFMKEEIPGVTSPMVYVAMLFSWFAWHVEDHDLHSLNYLHFGASKTWYGVPRDAASAFEDVVRVHGFGEEINPLVTFATLGEKTTVISPEVLINAGVPCCRLVQNAGEFVVTFPRAYHSGISHGFNCGEASNIATPEWLRFAKEAAIRRASINYPPMVSHFQLLYDLALSLCSRAPMEGGVEPRSCRLKDRKKDEGETLIKQMFVEDVMQNNELLFTLGQGSEVVLFPHNSSVKFVWSNLRVGSKYKVKPGLPFSLYSSEEAIKASDDIMLARDVHQTETFSAEGKHTPWSKKNGTLSQSGSETIVPHDIVKEDRAGDGLSKRGLFSCVKCGIWTFACVAIVQPTESAAQYLMSADCSFLNDWVDGCEPSDHGFNVTDGEAIPSGPDSFSESSEESAPNEIYDLPVESANHQVQNLDTSIVGAVTTETIEIVSCSRNKEDSSALGLLATAYGNISDSDEGDALQRSPIISNDNLSGDDNVSQSPTSQQGYNSGVERGSSPSECDGEDFPERFDLYGRDCLPRRDNSDDGGYEVLDCSVKFAEGDTMTSDLAYSPTGDENEYRKISNSIDPVSKPDFPFGPSCDEDSSRMHVFCLEHAVEVAKLLRPIGGAHIMLLCHPDYPNVQIEAKKVAEELEMDHVWRDITFSEATREDEERIQMALQSEEVTPKIGDWAVKLGINLFYSAVLSRSPLYNKQMPYNSVIYNAFGYDSPSKPSPEAKACGKVVGRQKKIVVAGKWCGKVWMSNHVHPLLLQRDADEEERATGAALKSEEGTDTKLEAMKKFHTAPPFIKIARKRKSRTQIRSVKKLKLEAAEFEDMDLKDTVDDNRSYHELRRSTRKSKALGRSINKVKPQEAEIQVSDSDEDLLISLCPQGLRRSSRTLKKPSKLSQKMTGDCYSDESLDDRSHNGQRANKTSVKPKRKSTRTLKASKKEMLGGESDSSVEESDDKYAASPQFNPISDDDIEAGPTIRVRRRPRRFLFETEIKPSVKRRVLNSKEKKAQAARKGPKMRLPVKKVPFSNDERSQIEEEGDKDEEVAELCCDIEGCTMSFRSKQELNLHKRNICPIEGCGKTFFSHKYIVQHQRVHMDDRPLKCPWKGCKMSFKWAWARTEHIRVHTGARPYICSEPGCGQTFRFVSDFSRHKRKTGHSAKKTRK